MHKFKVHNSGFLFSLYALFLLVTLAVPVVQAETTSPLLLFYSGNIQGETAPCG